MKKGGYNFEAQKAYESTKARIEKVVEIVNREYEAGDQRTMYKAIWRKYIYPEFGICYKTMLDYLRKKPSEYDRSKKGNETQRSRKPDHPTDHEKREL